MGHTGITCFSGKGHQRVLVQLASLVVGGFEDRRSAHGRSRRGDDGEVVPGYAEEDLPG